MLCTLPRDAATTPKIPKSAPLFPYHHRIHPALIVPRKTGCPQDDRATKRVSSGSIPPEKHGQEPTHRRVDLQLVGLRHLVVQLPDDRHDAAAAVDGEEAGRGLEGVEHAAPRPLVRIRGIHDENRRAHRSVLGKKKLKKAMDKAVQQPISPSDARQQFLSPTRTDTQRPKNSSPVFLERFQVIQLFPLLQDCGSYNSCCALIIIVIQLWSRWHSITSPYFPRHHNFPEKITHSLLKLVFCPKALLFSVPIRSPRSP